MQEKYAKEGLVAVSLNLDDPEDKKVMRNVHEFLKKQKVTFPSYVLNETQETWQEKLKITGPPVVFLFGRDGKVARKFDEGVDYKEVEKAALEELKKK
jgi:hypothetical protein